MHAHTNNSNMMPGTSHKGLAWLVILVASLFFFYEFIQMNCFNTLEPYLASEYNLSSVQIGEMSSLYFYTNALMLFPAGLMLDRFSTRTIIMIAMLICSVGTFFMGITHSIPTTAICRLATGLGAAFCFLSCIRLASRWFPSTKLAFVSGIIVLFAMAGGMVAQTPLSLLIDAVGWRHAMMVNGLLGFVIMAIIWVFVKDYPPNHEAENQHEHAQIHNLGVFTSLRMVLTNPQNWIGGVYTLLINLPIFLMGAIWGITYLVQVHNLNPTQASFVTMMLFFGTVVGSPAVGWFSDKIRRRKLPMILGAVISLFVMLAIVYLPNLSLNGLAVLFFILGFITSSQILSYPLIAEHNPLAITSTAISVASFSIMVSGMVCQPLFGYVLERNWDNTIINGTRMYTPDNFMHAMWIMVIGFIIGLVISFLVKETFCKSQAAELPENGPSDEAVNA